LDVQSRKKLGRQRRLTALGGLMIRKLKGSTAVITGATSGIGRETALGFARAGANVVVAGRRKPQLQELVADIQAKGGRALAVRADVSEQAQVDRLIKNAIDQFGRVDTLVNNAGVGLAARFEQQSLQDFRRVMEVNFWGAVYACMAVLPHMRTQPAGGVIINVSSIMGKRGMPFQTAYCSSKFALSGFSEALRTEVMADKIDVSTVFPGAVETEIFETSANQAGIQMPAYVPKFPAREMARIIVQDARFPQPEIVMALDAQAINFFNKVAPNLFDLALGWGVPFLDGLRRGAPAATGATGNLYEPGTPKRRSPSTGESE
jgi:NAD(P)-dependent dehydrogenase (short-subunit alcohol dehydrogenase family)